MLINTFENSCVQRSTVKTHEHQLGLSTFWLLPPPLGFTGSAHCTVQYGTDPTYMNLPYSAESTETGTAGDTVSVALRERLNSSTVYYYTVSTVSGDVTVRVQGTFTTPHHSKYCSHTTYCSHNLCISICDICQI